MNVRDLVPWSRSGGRDRNLPSLRESASPLFALHREMNRLFDDVFRDFDAPGLWGRAGWPQVEVEETDTEYRVTAELPGLEEKDVEVLVQDGVLIIKGEKRAENEDRRRAFSERLYGRFERRIGLDSVDDAAARAAFRNGVLTMTVPKSKETPERDRRAPINAPNVTH